MQNQTHPAVTARRPIRFGTVARGGGVLISPPVRPVVGGRGLSARDCFKREGVNFADANRAGRPERMYRERGQVAGIPAVCINLSASSNGGVSRKIAWLAFRIVPHRAALTTPARRTICSHRAGVGQFELMNPMYPLFTVRKWGATERPARVAHGVNAPIIRKPWSLFGIGN